MENWLVDNSDLGHYRKGSTYLAGLLLSEGYEVHGLITASSGTSAEGASPVTPFYRLASGK